MGASEPIAEVRGFDSFEVRLGDELRGERATLGKSLLDVQRDLRIKASYIAAIENCDAEVFPNKGFIAGYVRSYARFLGLDPEEIFERFCAESGFAGVNAELTREAGKPARKAALSPPAKVSRDDPLFSPVFANSAAHAPKWQDVSLSALGSLLVLIALITGLGYGGMRLLSDIQRVEIEAVDQRPEPMAELTEFVAPGLGTEQVLAEADPLPNRDRSLARLYQPTELEVPVLAARDGPIVEIDPDKIVPVASRSSRALDGIAAGELLEREAEAATLKVRDEQAAPIVAVVAQRPAWIRIYQADGTILFEKILAKGETYRLPEDADAPLLRAGNSGSVFVAIGGAVYGPVGAGTGVAKNVSLLPGDISEAFTELSEVPETLQSSITAAAELD